MRTRALDGIADGLSETTFGNGMTLGSRGATRGGYHASFDTAEMPDIWEPCERALQPEFSRRASRGWLSHESMALASTHIGLLGSPTVQRTDLQLLDAWRDGDLHAGNELFHRHFDAVCRFFANKVSDDVDDLIQRTFLGCVEGRERFRGDTGFRGYLFGVARNVLRRHFRDKRYFRERYTGMEVSAEDVSPGPSLLLAEKREQELLLQALRRIPLDHQITLELYYWENLSGRELADILEIPEGTLRGRIRRAKELLQEKLTELASSTDQLQSTLANLESWAKSLREQALKRGLGVKLDSTGPK